MKNVTILMEVSAKEKKLILLIRQLHLPDPNSPPLSEWEVKKFFENMLPEHYDDTNN